METNCKKREVKIESDVIDSKMQSFDNAQMFVGFVGAVACYAWLFLAFAVPLFTHFEVAFDITTAGFEHGFFALGAFLSLCGVWFFSDFATKHYVFFFVLSAIFGLVGLFGLLISLDTESAFLYFVCNMLLGFGCGLLYSQYGEFISSYFYAQIKDWVHGLFACAVLICCPLLFFPSDVRLGIAVVFIFVAYIAFGAVRFGFHAKCSDEAVGKAESDARQSVSWRSYFSTATAAITCGYALGCIASFWSELSFIHLIVLAVVVFSTCLALVIDSFHKQVINEALMMRLFLPSVAVVVLPLLLVDGAWKPLFAILLLCWSLIPLSCSIIAMFKHIIICELSTLRSFSLGRSVSFFGVAFGMLIALFGFMPSVASLFSPIAPTLSIVVFMLLIVFSTSFVMTEDNFPEEASFHIRNKDGETRVEVDPGVPIRKIDQSLRGSSRQIIEEIVVDESAVFHAKCDAIAQTYGLSNRQREVLSMLAKGRNGDYITEKLVISPHTAKAHIYNIYQKTGVHSRQELMDLVEYAEYDKDKLCETARNN